MACQNNGSNVEVHLAEVSKMVKICGENRVLFDNIIKRAII